MADADNQAIRANSFAWLSLIAKHLAHSLGRGEAGVVSADRTHTADMIDFLCGRDPRNLWKEPFGSIHFDDFMTLAAGYLDPDLKTRSNFRG